ncbi:MAG: hypothetical protein ACRDPT_06740 [Streptomycetales bacterium]
MEAFDLTGSLRDAGELAGCSHHTVARYVAAREAGGLSDRPAARPQLIDEFLPKLEEWVGHSRGKIRADKAHLRLLTQLRVVAIHLVGGHPTGWCAGPRSRSTLPY